MIWGEKDLYGRRLAIVHTSHHIALFLASDSLGQRARRICKSPLGLSLLSLLLLSDLFIPSELETLHHFSKQSN